MNPKSVRALSPHTPRALGAHWRTPAPMCGNAVGWKHWRTLAHIGAFFGPLPTVECA